jgi:hypothetical protein
LVGWYIVATTRKDLEDWWHAIVQKIDQSGIGTLTVPYPGGSTYSEMMIVSASTDESDKKWFNYTIVFEQKVPCVTV